MLANQLGGDDSALAKADRLALATRMELKEDLEKSPRLVFEDLLEEVLKKKSWRPETPPG